MWCLVGLKICNFEEDSLLVVVAILGSCSSELLNCTLLRKVEVRLASTALRLSAVFLAKH